MLKKLSKRNAKRQAMDYIIYIITLVITVVLMLSFNMVVFSEEISAIIKPLRAELSLAKAVLLKIPKLKEVIETERQAETTVITKNKERRYTR